MNKTCPQIQRALFRFYDKKNFPYMCTNTQALNQEADFVAVSRTGFITECEIKISRGDYFKDFKKEYKHPRMVSNFNKSTEPGLYCVNYFYFAVTDNLVQPEEVPEYAGLLWIDGSGKTHVMKQAPLLHRSKVTDSVIIKLLRSMMYKYFNQQ